MKPYPNMKDSGIEALGKVPAHWDVLRLRNVTEMRVSNVDKHSRQSEDEVRLCNYVDVYKNDRIRAGMPLMRATATADEIERFSLHSGDVLITKDSEVWNDIGVPALVEETEETNPRVVSGYHLALLRPYPERTDSGYLFRSLQSTAIASQLHVQANGVTRFGLTRGAIKAVRMPLPPLREQASIVRFLDHADRHIQRYIRARQKLIALLSEQKQAVIHEAVTGQIDIRTGRPYSAYMKNCRVGRLGKLPVHWQFLRLKRICRLAYGDSLSEANRRNGSVPVFGSNGRVGTHCAANTGAPCIIIGRKGSFGKVNYSRTPVFAIDTTFFVDSRYLSGHIRWLYFVLGWLRLDDVTRDSAVPGLDREEAYRRFVPVPSVSEQAAIVRYLDSATGEIDAVTHRLRRQVTLLHEYRKLLIDEVVTGKIEVRNGRVAMRVLE